MSLPHDDSDDLIQEKYKKPTLAQQVRNLKAWNTSLKKQLRKEESLRKQFAKLDEEVSNTWRRLMELRENPPRTFFSRVGR